jgi:zinc protease
MKKARQKSRLSKKFLGGFLIFLLFFCSTLSLASIQKYTLDNGLTVILEQVPTSEIISLGIWVKVGSRYEEEKFLGISHLVEHMVFKGTERRGPGQIEAEIEALGGYINASTSFDYTAYYLAIAAEFWEEALDVLVDMVLNPVFDPQELERERQVVLREVKQREDDPRQKLVQIFYQTLYKVHPYGKPIIGYEKTIMNIQREELIQFHRTYYVPNNMVLVAVGKLEEERLKKKIQVYFSNLPAKEVPQPLYPQEAFLKEREVKIEERDVEQVYLYLGYVGPSIVKREEVIALDLCMTLLGMGKSSRLYQSLVEKRALASSVGAGFATLKDPGPIYIRVDTSLPKLEEVEEEIKEQIGHLLREGIPEEELKKAKTLLSSRILFQIESCANRTFYYGYSEVLDSLDFALSYLDLLPGVSSEKIIQVADKYIDPENYTLVVLQPKQGEIK